MLAMSPNNGLHVIYQTRNKKDFYISTNHLNPKTISKKEENVCENSTFAGIHFCLKELFFCLNKHAQLLKEMVPLLFLCNKTKKK